MIRADHRQRRERDGDRDVDAARSHLETDRQQPRQRDLQQPEARQVDPRRRPGVAGAVERLREDQSVGEEHESRADDPQAIDGVRDDLRIGGVDRPRSAARTARTRPRRCRGRPRCRTRPSRPPSPPDRACPRRAPAPPWSRTRCSGPTRAEWRRRRCGSRSCSPRARRCRTSRSRAPARSSSTCRSGSAGTRTRSAGTRSTSPPARARDAASSGARGCGRRRASTTAPPPPCRGRYWWPPPRRSRPSRETVRGRKSGSGPSPMLIALASQSIRIAIAGSPAPRKIALIRNSSVTVALPASITCV